MAATPKAVKAAYDLASKVSIDGLYPVGIAVWFTQNRDPNKLFPGTTWKYIPGERKTVRLAAVDGSDIMTTGGSDTVTLSVDNLPVHGHAFSATTGSFNYGTKTSSSFDYGNKNINGAGGHAHQITASSDRYGGADFWQKPTISTKGSTSRVGDHVHTVLIGAHNHAVGTGAHMHSVSGTYF